jgi:hypothetical protein
MEDLKCPNDLAFPLPEDESDDTNFLKQREKRFVLRFKSTTEFGILEAPRYSHEFDRNCVGNRSSLPRGNLQRGNEPDPSFFKSIHLVGDGQTVVIEEARLKEKALWRSKIVVDDINFKVARASSGQPSQIDRYTDILRNPPMTLALKMLHRKIDSHGRPLGYQTAPLSLMNTGNYDPMSHLNKRVDKSKFVSDQDFKCYIHRDENVSKTYTTEYRRKHIAIDTAP